MLPGIFLGLMLSLSVICGLCGAKTSENPELCVVMSPLVTPYFTPWLDTPRKARGCWANSGHSAELHEVHVLVLQASPGSGHVTLQLKRITDKGAGDPSHSGTLMTETNKTLGRLALVLSADRPVVWHLGASLGDFSDEYDDEDETHSNLFASLPFVVVSEGSSVKADFPVNQSHQVWTTKKELHHYVRQQFSALASYTEVRGANLISLSIGMPGGQCNVHSLVESRVVSASQTVQLETEGCFHEDYIGDNPTDVYVVELDAGGRGHRPNRAPSPVLVQLQAEDGWPQPRNVALILKSHQPVRWQFGPTTGLMSNIIVVSDHEDQVENSNSPHLEVRSISLPDSWDALLLSVMTEFGPPVLYAKTGRASTLRLLIGSKSKAGLRNGAEEQGADAEDSHELMQQQPNYAGAALVSGFAAQEPHSSPVGQLKAAMLVQCEKTQIVVTFPANLIQELGVTHLHFNDVTCKWQLNATHATLISHITSCGTTSDTNGRLTSFSNSVYIRFGPAESDDEDFEASGSSGDGAELDKIPVVCRYQPHFPGDKFNVAGADSVLVSFTDIVDSEPSNPHSLYHLELFRDRLHTQKIEFNGPNLPYTEVEFDETVYVKAWMDGVVPVQVVTENCWLSNVSNPHQGGQQVVLLRNTCPLDLSVQLTPVGQHGSFSFHISRDYGILRIIYVHCRLGVCTQEPERAKGNLALCVDSKQYCSSKSLRPYLDKAVSTAQQLATQGPLLPVLRRRKVSSSLAVPSAAPAEEQVHTKVVYVGVSTEVTVGIALASFVIGVGLTGTLWCIHMKTGLQ
ncbi:transforming growth factor beta receptor type 3 [Anabrus simplex]|uniref:transforming growth factor beta receptor type 3 n=1 Tax=Anabrus simplex TaxID=316456 RepID=UPI0035A38C04